MKSFDVPRFAREALSWRRRHPRSYNLGRAAVGLLVSVALGYLAVRGLAAQHVSTILSDFSLTHGLVALGVFLLSNVVRAYRWQRLFLRERVSLWRLFVVQNAGIGLNNLMPIRMFSEVAQFAILTARDRVSAATALATLGIERVLDMVANTLLLGLGLMLLPQLGGVIGFGPQLGFAVVLSLLWVGAMQLFALGSSRWGFIQRIPLLQSFSIALAEVERRWKRMLISFLATIAYWILLGVSAAILARGLGLSLSLSAAVVTVVAVTLFATSLPSLPGALGTFEFAAVYMLDFFAFTREDALGFAILLHLLLYVPPIVVALVMLPRETLAAMRKPRSVDQGKTNGTPP
ncbi:MAG: flippase-like domain-containing protein [Chloroflexi bacterium]|nr:flippase-like domain-containing protein [Chloroflexota bacterium]